MTNTSDSYGTASAEAAKSRSKVMALLDAGKPAEALKSLSRDSSDWACNARAVCYLRLGEAQMAIDTLRGMVVTGHLNLRKEAPAVFKSNFATALFLSGNIGGGESVLSELRNEADDSVTRLRAAYQKWRSSMTFWEKLRSWFSGEPMKPFTFEHAPGDL